MTPNRFRHLLNTPASEAEGEAALSEDMNLREEAYGPEARKTEVAARDWAPRPSVGRASAKHAQRDAHMAFNTLQPQRRRRASLFTHV